MAMAPPPSPGAAPQSGGQSGAGPAQQAIQMIQQGFQGLGKLIQQSGQSLPPDDIKLFQQAVSATDAMIQSLSGGGGEEQGPPPRQMQSGPMAANANAGARPAPNQG